MNDSVDLFAKNLKSKIFFNNSTKYFYGKIYFTLRFFVKRATVLYMWVKQSLVLNNFKNCVTANFKNTKSIQTIQKGSKTGLRDLIQIKRSPKCEQTNNKTNTGWYLCTWKGFEEKIIEIPLINSEEIRVKNFHRRIIKPRHFED